MDTLIEQMLTPVVGGRDITRGEEVCLKDGTPVIVEAIHHDNGTFCIPVGWNVGSWICATKLYRLSPERKHPKSVLHA